METVLPLETEEERKIRLRIESRRKRAEDRRQHFLQPKTLSCAVVKDEIDRQIEEKEIEKEKQKIAQEMYEEERQRLQAQMAELEYNREVERNKMLINQASYWLNQHNLRPAQVPDIPVRLSDRDQRLGISSGQIFLGEDLNEPERRRLQQLQMRKWVAEQQEVVNMKKKQEYEEEMELAREIARKVELGKKMEEERRKYDQKKYMEMTTTNKILSTLKKENDYKEECNVKDFAPLETASSLSFLKQENNKDYPFDYRGMTQEEIEKIKEQQIEQIYENENKRKLEREEEKRWVDIHEKNIHFANEQAYLHELDRLRKDRETNMYNENLKLLKQERDRKEINSLREFGESNLFFNNFGRMER